MCHYNVGIASIKRVLLAGLFVPLMLFSSMAQSTLLAITDVSQLDFSGSFLYALNFNGSGSQTIGDATFTNVSANGTGAPGGVTVSGFNQNDVWGGASNLGASTDNNTLENIMSSIIWTNSQDPGSITLSVASGTKVKVQLMFSEYYWNLRHFDVDVENEPTEVIIGTDLGGPTWQVSDTQGYALSYVFTVGDGLLNIDLSRHIDSAGDTNYLISGLTVENVPEPATLALLSLGLLGLGFRRKA